MEGRKKNEVNDLMLLATKIDENIIQEIRPLQLINIKINKNYFCYYFY